MDSRTIDEAGENVRAALADCSNALVLDSTDDGVGDLCQELLLVDEPARTNLLWVTYTDTPDDCLRKWLQHAGERPADVKVVSVGDVMRSGAAAQSGSTASRSPNAVVDSIANPADFTGLGITISEQLERWASTDAPTVVCFDSLTTAAQYVDLQTLYQFLHVLTGRFELADAVAHFHLDPVAHDDVAVNTLTSLFEAVVEHKSGEWHVSTR